jgi:hypothetical protein
MKPEMFSPIANTADAAAEHNRSLEFARVFSATKDEKLRDAALFYSAAAAARRGRIDEAVAIARMADDPAKRAEFLSRVVGTAEKASSEVLRLPELKDGDPRAYALAGLAVHASERGEVHRAVVLARQCDVATFKLQAYRAILLAYARKRNPRVPREMETFVSDRDPMKGLRAVSMSPAF